MFGDWQAARDHGNRYFAFASQQSNGAVIAEESLPLLIIRGVQMRPDSFRDFAGLLNLDGRDSRDQFLQRPRKLREQVAALQVEHAALWDRLQVWNRTDRDCQLRHTFGLWRYLLENPVRLRKSIPVKGWLSLWIFTLPD